MTWVAQRGGNDRAAIGTPLRVHQKLARVAVGLWSTLLRFARHQIHGVKGARHRIQPRRMFFDKFLER